LGNKLFAFGRIDGDEVTTCLDAATGDVVWQDKYPTAPVYNIASSYAGPRSTPAVAEGKIFTLGVNGTVSCLDVAKGKVVWRKETKPFPKFNSSTSPLIVDGKCVVFLDALTAFDPANGDVKWMGPKGGVDGPYGSPVLMTVDGTKQIVTPATKSLVGVSVADGKELWHVDLPKGSYSITYGTPVIDGRTVIYGVALKGSGITLAFTIEKKGDSFTATELWKSTGSYQYNTPVLDDGLLFGLSTGRTFYCTDAKSGKELWKDSTPRGEAGGVLNAGSVILALTGPPSAKGKGSETASGDSELVAFEPSRTGFKEVAHYKLSPSAGLAYPIVVGNRVYVKGNSEITLWTVD
jgi:outer membrane protein assembly factor BamB